MLAGKASIADTVFCLWLSLHGGNHILILLQPKTVILIALYAVFLQCCHAPLESNSGIKPWPVLQPLFFVT